MESAVQQARSENTPLGYGGRRTSAGWAFEFLRRNPKFISAAGSNEERANTGNRIGGVTVVAAGEGDSTEGFGVLYCDRCDSPIENAIVFWARNLSVDIIDARIINSSTDETEDNVLRLEKFKCDQILLTGKGHTPQLLLKTGSKQIQINCIGGDFSSSERAIIPQIALVSFVIKLIRTLRKTRRNVLNRDARPGVFLIVLRTILISISIHMSGRISEKHQNFMLETIDKRQGSV